MYLKDTRIDIATLPPCAECLRVAELLADPDMAPPLHRRPPRPDFASGFTGEAIRSILRTDMNTADSVGRRAAVHLLTSPRFRTSRVSVTSWGSCDLVWDMGDTVRMGQVTDWAAVVDFAAAADVPDRDRQLIAVAASLAGGPPVALEAAVSFFGEPGGRPAGDRGGRDRHGPRRTVGTHREADPLLNHGLGRRVGVAWMPYRSA